MIKNNIEVDVKVKCIEAEKTQVQIAEEIGTTSQYVNRIIKKKNGVVNKTFVQMIESLGYDIELTYVKSDAKYEHIKQYKEHRRNFLQISVEMNGESL